MSNAPSPLVWAIIVNHQIKVPHSLTWQSSDVESFANNDTYCSIIIDITMSQQWSKSRV